MVPRKISCFPLVLFSVIIFGLYARAHIIYFFFFVSTGKLKKIAELEHELTSQKTESDLKLRALRQEHERIKAGLHKQLERAGKGGTGGVLALDSRRAKTISKTEKIRGGGGGGGGGGRVSQPQEQVRYFFLVVCIIVVVDDESSCQA